MRDANHPARLTRPWRAHLLAAALPLGVVLVAGCTGSSGSPAAAATPGAATPSLSAVSDCLFPPAACYTPAQFRVAYGIQPLLERGIDGQGETVTNLVPAAPTNLPPGTSIIQSGSSTIRVAQPPGQPPEVTDIRQDLAKFDSLFGLPAARIQVVTSLGQARPRPGRRPTGRSGTSRNCTWPPPPPASGWS